METPANVVEPAQSQPEQPKDQRVAPPRPPKKRQYAARNIQIPDDITDRVERRRYYDREYAKLRKSEQTNTALTPEVVSVTPELLELIVEKVAERLRTQLLGGAPADEEHGDDE